jgi:hypothetical protein
MLVIAGAAAYFRGCGIHNRHDGVIGKPLTLDTEIVDIVAEA